MWGLKSLEKQIGEIETALKKSSILVFISFILIVFITIANEKPQTTASKLLLGSSYYLTIFLLLLLVYKLYKEMNKTNTSNDSLVKQIKQTNYLFFILWVLLCSFTAFLLIKYVTLFSEAIGFTAGFLISIVVIIPILMFFFLGIPLFCGKFFFTKARKANTIKDKIAWYLPILLILLVFIPLIQYLLPKNVYAILDFLKFLLYFPVIVGIPLLLVAIEDFFEFYRKRTRKLKKKSKTGS